MDNKYKKAFKKFEAWISFSQMNLKMLKAILTIYYLLLI